MQQPSFSEALRVFCFIPNKLESKFLKLPVIIAIIFFPSALSFPSYRETQVRKSKASSPHPATASFSFP